MLRNLEVKKTDSQLRIPHPTTLSKRHEQAIDDYPTSWKTKQEHRKTKRGTLEWCLLARHQIGRCRDDDFATESRHTPFAENLLFNFRFFSISSILIKPQISNAKSSALKRIKFEILIPILFTLSFLLLFIDLRLFQVRIPLN